MKLPRLTFWQTVGWLGFALVFLIVAAITVWRGDILKAGLDPQIPFQTYDPPPPPDYASADAWAMKEVRAPTSGPAAIFFLHSTTFDGGRDWNGPIGDPEADAYLERVVIPNYAGPFARAGAISLPRYRQASLYTRLTLRDDARDARAFAYGDTLAAFEVWLAAHPTGPLLLAGVEQGGELIDRLVRERVADDAALRSRIVAVYLIDVIVAADSLSPAIPACATATSIGCIVGWSQVGEDNDGAVWRRLRRALRQRLLAQPVLRIVERDHLHVGKPLRPQTVDERRTDAVWVDLLNSLVAFFMLSFVPDQHMKLLLHSSPSSKNRLGRRQLPASALD